MRWVLACVVVLAACYEPRLPDCAVQCAADADCAPGQACRADGWCAAPDVACEPSSVGDFDTISGTPVDAGVDATMPPLVDAALPPPPDAAGGDAPTGCAPGCPGLCENGVCVIRCLGEKSCEGRVRCPAQGACEVICAGEKSCKNGVECGAGRCEVRCSGEKSCEKGVDCEDACACDVDCSGEKSCKEAATCSRPWCEAGDGCHTWGACDACS